MTVWSSSGQDATRTARAISCSEFAFRRCCRPGPLPLRAVGIRPPMRGNYPGTRVATWVALTRACARTLAPSPPPRTDSRRRRRLVILLRLCPWLISAGNYPSGISTRRPSTSFIYTPYTSRPVKYCQYSARLVRFDRDSVRARYIFRWGVFDRGFRRGLTLYREICSCTVVGRSSAVAGASTSWLPVCLNNNNNNNNNRISIIIILYYAVRQHKNHSSKE